jgi:peptidyl-prolyl cis-trans isomerase A (cyclophilin A)
MIMQPKKNHYSSFDTLALCVQHSALGVIKSAVTVLLIILSISGCQSKQDTATPHIEIETQYGTIELELYAQKAPTTVAAFLGYVDSGYYNNASFYRVLNQENQPSDATKTELIQGGIWKTQQARAATVKGIPHETTAQTGIHHTNGVISLARREPGTAGTEFFICIGDQPGLDYGGENIADKQGYAAFGKVVQGMDVVRKIYRQNEEDQYFSPPVMIYSIKRK